MGAQVQVYHFCTFVGVAKIHGGTMCGVLTGLEKSKTADCFELSAWTYPVS